MPTISKAAGQVASGLGAGAQKQRCECTDAGCAADVHQHRAVRGKAPPNLRVTASLTMTRATLPSAPAESDENQRAGAGEASGPGGERHRAVHASIAGRVRQRPGRGYDR